MGVFEYESQEAMDDAFEDMIEREAEKIRLRERLELSEEHDYDGIHCRDETIKLQGKQIAQLKARVESLVDLCDAVISRWEQQQPIEGAATAREMLRDLIEKESGQ